MPCYSPLHAFKGKGQDAQKTVIVFKKSDSFRGERLDLPCGQCIGCRLERSRQWAVRCMHEASLYKENSFVTFTYDDAHLPSSRSLDKSHFPKFMKRLRKRFGGEIRYYQCGEYGDLLGRPHHHALLFNLGFPDKVLHSVKNGIKVYTSNELSKVWTAGLSVIGDVTFESAAYVARYVMKKITGPKAEAHYEGRVPEFVTMSRRPGIGAGWFEKFESDVYPRDYVVVRGVRTRVPRFYDSRLALKDPALLAHLKIGREYSARHFVDDVLSDGKKIKVSDQDGQRLMVKSEVAAAKIKALLRPLEV